ncbi:MAG: TldD/PmbA family protein [Planctomycetota bacterium]|nr:TldD/PmbA family protein [Planctomycetota bacterium]
MDDLVRHLCDLAKRRGVDFADARAVQRHGESVLVQDGRADKLAASTDRGIGVRVLVGRAWGFASADSLQRRRAEACVDDAIALAKASEAFVTDPARMAEIRPIEAEDRTEPEIAPGAMPVAEKIDRLLACERAGRATDANGAQIVNSIVSYAEAWHEEVLANTAGTLLRSAGSRAVATTLFVATDGRILQRGTEQRGIVGGAELLRRVEPEAFSVRAARKALAALDAKPAPAGRFTVLFHPSITGLLVHEALGHNAEADAVWAGESILEGRLGDEIASPAVSVYDDSMLPGQFGSFAYDSEGTPGRRRPIIEEGRLVAYLHSLETAAKFDAEPTGSARAESYDCRPLVRMSNTFLEPAGTDTGVPLAEMLRGVDRGIYLEDGHWGYVFVQKGQFICHAGQAHMIEHGEVGEPLRDVSISSLTLDVLRNIDAVGDDFEMEMPGMCGKDGQSAPTDCGGPHVRVQDVVVGGQHTL